MAGKFRECWVCNDGSNAAQAVAAAMQTAVSHSFLAVFQVMCAPLRQSCMVQRTAAAVFYRERQWKTVYQQMNSMHWKRLNMRPSGNGRRHGWRAMQNGWPG